MRLLQFIVILWFCILLNALECAQGTVIRRGGVVSRKEQENMMNRSGSSHNSCYSILNSSSCSKRFFSVSLAAVAPFASPYPSRSDPPCWQKNSTLVCSCDDSDLCNIRLYDLQQDVLSHKLWSDPGWTGCYDQLLNSALPKRPTSKDNSVDFPSSFRLRWWHYLLGVTIAVNAAGFALHCGDAVNTSWKSRKKRKEEERQRKMSQQLKVKRNSGQYQYLWPLRDDCVPEKTEKAMGNSEDKKTQREESQKEPNLRQMLESPPKVEAKRSDRPADTTATGEKK